MTDAASTASSIARPRPTPLWAVGGFSFLNSFGTAIITSGIYIITDNTYRFSQSMNYLLGVVIGITYIAATLGTGRAMAWLRSKSLPVSGRGTLIAVMALTSLSCCLPFIADRFQAADEARSSWPVWVMIVVYIPLTGVLWPIVESYVSGGRRGEPLRSAMGTWNFVWSSATMVAYWVSAPIIKQHAPLLILILGALHLAAGTFLFWFSPEPATHDQDHDPHPAVYDKLLLTFRILLPTCYIFNTALLPFLPGAMKALNISVAWRPIVQSSFALARCVTFYLAGRWHAWHGRWSTPIVGSILLFSGFAAALLSPQVKATESSWPGILVLSAGLVVFGVGMALIYTAAIYYAMAVGNSEVDAGGKHEALIGVGYAVGPLCGLIPAWAIDSGHVPQSVFEPFVLSSVGLIGVIAAALVLHRVWKHS